MQPKKSGGKRLGAGRKKKEPTVLKRIPVSMADEIDHLIKNRMELLYGVRPQD